MDIYRYVHISEFRKESTQFCRNKARQSFSRIVSNSIRVSPIRNRFQGQVQQSDLSFTPQLFAIGIGVWHNITLHLCNVVYVPKADILVGVAEKAQLHRH